MQIIRVAAVMLLSIALASCATSSNILSPQEIAGMRIDKVDVTFAPGADINWPVADQEYAASVGAQSAPPKIGIDATVQEDDAYTKAIRSPEARAYRERRLADRISKTVDEQVKPHFRGTRSVTLKVEVVNFTIPTAVQRVVLGGTPALIIKRSLVDTVTGKELAANTFGSAAYAGNGLLGVAIDQAFDDLDVRVFNEFGTQTRNWLLKS